MMRRKAPERGWMDELSAPISSGRAPFVTTLTHCHSLLSIWITSLFLETIFNPSLYL